MGSPLKGDIGFKIGDESYKLSFSAEAIFRLEKKLGKKVIEIGKEMSDTEGVDLGMFRTIFWAGLIDGGYVDVDDVESVRPFFSAVKLPQVASLVSGAFFMAFDIEAEVPAKTRPTKPSQKQVGTGSAS